MQNLIKNHFRQRHTSPGIGGYPDHVLLKLKLISEKSHPYLNEGVKIIILFFLVAAGAIFIIHSGLSIGYPYPMDYGEAPLIDQAVRLSKGVNIYRTDLDTPPYTISNYPPLYVISLIPFLHWLDSPFHMARVVSVLATLLSALFIGLTIHTLTKDRFTATTAAFFFLANPFVVQWSGLARVDSLALGFATGAIFLLARWPRSRWGWLGGGLLLVAAIYTRQSYALAAPLAAFAWLWTQDKRRALELALFVGGIGIGLFFLLHTLTDGGFAYNVLIANVNEFSMERLNHNLKRLWDDAWIILIMGGGFVALGWRSQKSWSLLAFFLIGASLSALTIGKIGSNINYFLELAAATALTAGIVIAWSKPHPWINTAVFLLLTIQLGIQLESSMSHSVDLTLAPRLMDFHALQLLEEEVKATDGPILADEYMGLLTMNDRPLYIQPFEVTQLANAGMWDEQPLLNEIASKKFGRILIHHFGTWEVYKERWSPQMLEMIDRYYRPYKTLAGTVIYIPKKGSGIASIPPAAAKTDKSLHPMIEEGALPIGEPGFIGEPSIAINPTNPNHLVAIVTRASQQDCDPPQCEIELVFYASNDAGGNWQSPATFRYPQQVMYNGQVIFDPNGTLYILGLRDDVVTLNQTTAAEEYLPSKANFKDATRSRVNARPWLRVHPQTGELFLTFDAQESNRLFVTPSLKRSDDGVRWSITTRAHQHVSVADIFSPRATGPEDIQVLFGEGGHLSLVWVWDSNPWSWPRTVWMANSIDGGITFGEPTPIAETWGPINTISANGLFAIVYRSGSEAEQRLVVATTSDSGQTWHSTIASGNVPLFFDVSKAPGINISPDGTIDLVFYAHGNNASDCIQNLESWQRSLPFGGVDHCEYDVFYTYSEDGGASFAEPVQLNPRPIRGEDFVRIFGGSAVGSHLAVASGSNYAYPIWIGTPQPGRTQLYTARIKR